MSKIQYERIGDGVAIYKPIRSPFFWYRVRVDNHPSIKEIRKSLKTSDRYEAIFLAKKMQTEIEVKVQNNIDLVISKPHVTKLIKEAVERLKNKKPFKKNYNEYIRIFEKDLMVYFDKNRMRIDELDRFNIEDYFNDAKKNSQTQIAITKTCFKFIFEEALRGKWIKEQDVPKISKVERMEKKQKRDFFNETELATILYSYSDFIDESIKDITKHNRFLLLAYSFFLNGSGVGPDKSV